MVLGNFIFADELYGVGALDVATYTLGKAPKFIGGGDDPSSLVDWLLQ